MVVFKKCYCFLNMIQEATGGKIMASLNVFKYIIAVLVISYFILLQKIGGILEEKQKYRLNVLQGIIFTQFITFCFAMYVWSNLSCHLNHVRSPYSRKIFNILLAMCLLLAQTAVVSGYILSNVEPHWFVMVAYLCLGITLLFSFVIFICQVLEYCLTIFYKARTKRLLVILRTLLILFLTGLLTIIAIHNAWRLPEIKHYKLNIPTLPPSFKGLTVLQLSDVHIGPTIGRTDIEMIVEMSNNQKPDIVVFTGDLIDAPFHVKPAVQVLSKLQTKHGVYYVAGNHDFYTGYIDEWITELKQLNVSVLHNEYVPLSREKSSQDKIYLSGVFDHEGGLLRSKEFGEQLSEALSGRESGVPTILLAHRPSAGKRAVTYYNDISLVLCGHTHGGQVLPLLLWHLISEPFMSGLHKIHDSYIYVSSGVHYWGMPMRQFSRPEIPIFTLY